MPTADPLSHKEIEDRLAELPGWRLSPDGDTLARDYRLPHLAAAICLLHIVRVQDELQQHAALILSRGTLRVVVGDGRLTDRDFDLARRIESIAAAHGAR